jgi:sugar lactone lactonase YvrE
VGQFGGGTAGTRTGDVNRARFLEPRAIVIDAEGSIYVADTGETMADGNQSRGRLQVVDGTSGDCLLSLDRLGRNLGCLFRPGGLAIATVPDAIDGMHHARGDLYVADTLNHRILRFAWYQRPG